MNASASSSQSPDTVSHDVRVLVLSPHDPFVEALRAIWPETATCQVVSGWEEAESQLVERVYDLVCLDYGSLEVGEIHSFVQLDNILQKEDTLGAFLVRKGESSRARELYDMLDAFEGWLEIDDPSSPDQDRLRQILTPLLERQAASPSSAGPQAMAGHEDGESSASESHTISVPEVTEGELDGRTLLQLLHYLNVREETGVLTLTHEAIERRYVFEHGALLESMEADVSMVNTLKPAFAWEGGKYDFEPRSSVQGTPVELYSLILEGLYNHLSQRAALNELTSRMNAPVMRTDRWGPHRDALAAYDELEQFVSSCDGGDTLELALSNFGANSRRGFQAAYFALATDLVVSGEAIDGRAPPLQVRYALESPSGGPDDARQERTPSDSSDSGDEDSDETTSLERRIRETHRDVQSSDAYDIFDLWKGCGEQKVQERFYELVQEYHPDTYGENLSDELDHMAQQTFVDIKDARSTLLQREDEQTVSPSEVRSEEEHTSGLDTPSAAASDESSDVIASSNRDLGDDRRSKTLSDDASSKTDDESPHAGLGLNTSSAASLSDESPQATELGDETSMGDESGTSRPRTRNERRSDMSRETGFEESDQDIEELLNKHDSSPTPTSTVDEQLDSEEDAQDLFNKGYKAFKNDAESKAFEHISRAHEFDPDNALYKTFYGYLLFLEKPDRREEARTLLEEAIEMENEQVLPDAHLYLGRLLRVEDKDHQARRHFERSLRLNPSSVEAQRELRVYEMRSDDESLDTESIVEEETATPERDEAASNEDDEGTSFSEDPAGYIKELLNKDIF